MNIDSKKSQTEQLSTYEQNSNDWSEYWKHGSLTTFFGGDYQVGYSGDILFFWESVLESMPAATKIVDLATGNGAIPFIAAVISEKHDKRFSIVGIDYADIRLPSDSAIQDRMKGVDLLGNTPMERTGLDESSVDLITSQYGFEYGDQDSVLDEIQRIAKPGAKLALVLHHPDSAVVIQAKLEYRQTQMCISEERLDRKVRDLIKIVGDARTPEQRAQLKHNRDAEKLREQINRTMGRLLKRVHGQDDSQLRQVAQSFLRVFSDLSSLSKQEKLKFVENSSKEFLAYAGRMEAMSRATLSDQGFDGLLRDLESRGFKVEKNNNLKSLEGQLVARSIYCTSD